MCIGFNRPGYEIPNTKHQITNKYQIFTLWNPAFGRFANDEIPQGRYQMTKTGLVRRRRIAHCDLPFDLPQGGESFDTAQDRELVEPFGICKLLFGIFWHSDTVKQLAIFTGKAT